ncbi:MAG: BlaI/MecI/CopY family transcriptional regulator [Chitinophagaceae bacterium]|nr:BlaI/MecI/CopY family transcriptional regulator [Chitinophagaceae bacterium]MCB0742180.1 BlaI/MecI/CopY family transcriptional regulator [Chitinophagaceae bacterium]HQU56820.1 BlaI/MecI/CopY family transcriptional regulator [Chitinophagaceae bacterium]HQV06159.1 BlaI/MecI/CopY family transcriptional regulator [Chitinophagaceae bacterium]
MEKLTPSEEFIMQAVWQACLPIEKPQENNIKSFMEIMKDPPPYTTVASIVKNLEKKGFLKSRRLGNAYLYKPIITEKAYKKKFMGNVVKEYFDNSYKELVNFFIEEKKISAQELKEIVSLIEKGNLS